MMQPAFIHQRSSAATTTRRLPVSPPPAAAAASLQGLPTSPAAAAVASLCGPPLPSSASVLMMQLGPSAAAGPILQHWAEPSAAGPFQMQQPQMQWEAPPGSDDPFTLMMSMRSHSDVPQAGLRSHYCDDPSLQPQQPDRRRTCASHEPPYYSSPWPVHVHPHALKAAEEEEDMLPPYPLYPEPASLWAMDGRPLWEDPLLREGVPRECPTREEPWRQQQQQRSNYYGVHSPPAAAMHDAPPPAQAASTWLPQADPSSHQRQHQSSYYVHSPRAPAMQASAPPPVMGIPVRSPHSAMPPVMGYPVQDTHQQSFQCQQWQQTGPGRMHPPAIPSQGSAGYNQKQQQQWRQMPPAAVRSRWLTDQHLQQPQQQGDERAPILSNLVTSGQQASGGGGGRTKPSAAQVVAAAQAVAAASFHSGGGGGGAGSSGGTGFQAMMAKQQHHPGGEGGHCCRQPHMQDQHLSDGGQWCQQPHMQDPVMPSFIPMVGASSWVDHAALAAAVPAAASYGGGGLRGFSSEADPKDLICEADPSVAHQICGADDPTDPLCSGEAMCFLKSLIDEDSQMIDTLG